MAVLRLVLFCVWAGSALADPLALASELRLQAGLLPLREDPVLARAAQMQASHMAARRRIGHDGPDGNRLSDRVRGYGHRDCWLAENVAGGQRNGLRAMADWMTSPPHRANILHPRMRRAAIAHARGADGRLYWSMVLSGPC